MDIILDWLKEIFETLCLPLEGQENSEQAQGNEYEIGIEIQQKAKSYHDELVTLLRMRQETLTTDPKVIPTCDTCRQPLAFGAAGFITTCAHKFCQDCHSQWPAILEQKRSKKRKNITIKCPACSIDFKLESLDKLEMKRAYTSKFKRPLVDLPLQKQLFSEISHLELGFARNSYKTLMQKVKSICTDFHIPLPENNLAKIAYDHMLEQLKGQIQDLDTIMTKLIPLFTNLHNAREKYYTQLNYISDSVNLMVFEEGSDCPSLLSDVDKRAKSLESKLSQNLGRKRYLMNLKTLESAPAEMCIICREDFVSGCITECGHLYCESCAGKWVKVHRKCPMCGSSVAPSSLAAISFSAKTNSSPQDQDIQKRLVSLFCLFF